MSTGGLQTYTSPYVNRDIPAERHQISYIAQWALCLESGVDLASAFRDHRDNHSMQVGVQHVHEGQTTASKVAFVAAVAWNCSKGFPASRRRSVELVDTGWRE